MRNYITIAGFSIPQTCDYKHNTAYMTNLLYCAYKGLFSKLFKIAWYLDLFIPTQLKHRILDRYVDSNNMTLVNSDKRKKRYRFSNVRNMFVKIHVMVF